MIPQINKYEFYLYRDFRDGDNPLNLVQLIAHADAFFEDENLSVTEQNLIAKRKELCSLFFEDTWSSRNGKVQFFFDFKGRKSVEDYYHKLIFFAGEFNLEHIIDNLRNSIEFYIEHEIEIKKLSKYEGAWEEDVRNLENRYTYHYPTMKELATRIIENPNDYCRDKNGESIDPNYTGKLKHYLKTGTLRHEYTLVNGQILGEFVDYDNDGNKKGIFYKDGYLKQESIKTWYPDGQIKFEKINDTDYKYWYKNGQLKVKSTGGELERWDEDGNELN